MDPITEINMRRESHHNANFIVNGGTARLTKTFAATDDDIGIMTTLDFQWYIWILWPATILAIYFMATRSPIH